MILRACVVATLWPMERALVYGFAVRNVLPKAAGSNPARVTGFLPDAARRGPKKRKLSISSLRAGLVFGVCCPAEKSPLTLWFAWRATAVIAPLPARRSRNPKVVSSILTHRRALHGQMAAQRYFAAA